MDSRRAAQILSKKMQRVIDAQRRIILFLICIIFAFGVTFAMAHYEESLNMIQIYVVFILFLAISLWVTEAVPPFAVGLFIVGLLIFFIGNSATNIKGQADYIDVKTFVQTWSNSVIWLMLGGFFLAEALKITGLDKDLFRLSISRVGNNPKHIILGLMMATGIASMIMSNTATTAMMIASIMPFIDVVGYQNRVSKALLIGIPASAAIGGVGTIIGSPPNAIAVDAINNLARDHGDLHYISFLDWMIYGVPIALILMVVFWFILIKVYKIKNTPIEIDFLHKKGLESQMEKFNKRMVIGVLIITVLLWLTGSVHGIPSAAISGIPIIVLPMLGIITGVGVRKLPWDTLMLVAGGLSLGIAIQQSGLADFFVSKISNYEFYDVVFLIIFAFATLIFSNIMSNTATATILIPVATILPGVNPIEAAVVIGLSASFALFLPVSTPPNAIAFSTGYLKQSDFKLGGFWIGLLGPVLTILWVLLLSYFGFMS
ncbi:SLC13 family permease [Ornithobacterium rhinotracheale]|uniref:SLC13 family permease n=1 Tax=Ornithobacterium rhinotracheale TaxID=28251 RepID=UPI003FA47728